MISFRAKNMDEVNLIDQIGRRGTALAAAHGGEYPRLDVRMDVTACHVNGMPLDLEGLLAAEDGDFGHDVFGIRRHLNRETGKLEDCFVPRLARKE